MPIIDVLATENIEPDFILNIENNSIIGDSHKMNESLFSKNKFKKKAMSLLKQRDFVT